MKKAYKEYSLKFKITSSIALVVLLTIGLISLLANIIVERRFTEYLSRQQDKRTQEIVTSLSVLYNKKTDTWDHESIHALGMFSLYDGYILDVIDTNNQSIWDAQAHDMTLCNQVMDSISDRMGIKYPQIKGSFTSTVYHLTQNDQIVGSVSIAYYGPVFFTENDSLFLDSLNVAYVIIGIAALAFSAVVGMITAKRLSMPILKTVEAAKRISDGRYGIRLDEKYNTTELSLLTRSINQMASSLESQETMRKQLTADVAHELRTPLTTLQTHLEAMIEGVWKPTPERLQSAYDEAVRLAKLVQDLESLARTENSILTLNKTDIHLQESIQSIITACEAELNDKNLHVSVSGTCSPIQADQDRIRQVIFNLLSNAIKYSRIGGFIRFELSDCEQSIQFEIEDDGIGVSENELPMIFERFYRADKSRNRLTGGSGLGLAIVKSIVEAHGGSISVRSELDKGSSFTVLLPK